MRAADIVALKGDSVRTAHPWTPTAELVRRMTGPPAVGALVVCADAAGHVVGLVTERDVTRALLVWGEAALTRPTSEVMTRHRVAVCGPEDSLPGLMALMTRYRQRHLPMVADGVLRGVISIGDVVSRRVAELELEAGVLRDQAASRR